LAEQLRSNEPYHPPSIWLRHQNIHNKKPKLPIRLVEQRLVETHILMVLPSFFGSEVTYETRIAQWWLLQPDLQLIFHPGGYTSASPPNPWGSRSPARRSSVFAPGSRFEALPGQREPSSQPAFLGLCCTAARSDTCI
jgi:hypothetical protein